MFQQNTESAVGFGLSVNGGGGVRMEQYQIC